MADTLEIFGVEYPNATGIKATDDNGVVRAFIRPTGTKSISANGTGIDVTSYASVDVAVPSGSSSLQSKSVSYTPTETAQSQTVTADSGYDGLSSVDVSVDAISSTYIGTGVTRKSAATYTPSETEQSISAGQYLTGQQTISAISSTYVGSGITRRSSSDLTASGATVTVPSGFYDSQATKTVASGTEGTPTATKGTVSNHAISVTPSVTNTAGYISGGTHTGTAVSVSASELVSGTLSITSSGTKDVTNYASASVAAGTEGTPTATKGTVSNHSVSVTPSVTNTTGYITGGTKTGTAVSISASELVSGTKTISANGTGIDVTNYASVDVAVPSGTPSLQSKSVSYTPTETAQSQTVTADSGYDGLSQVSVSVGAIPIMSTYTSGVDGEFQTINNQRKFVAHGYIEAYSSGYLGVNFEPDQYFTLDDQIMNAVPANTIITPSTSAQTVGGYQYVMESAVTVAAMPSGTAGTPSATKGTVSNHSVSVTPSVTNTTGYITGSTKTGTAVTVSASELVSGSETKTANGTYDVTNLASLVVAVPIVTYYTGSSAPSSSTGSDGDIYLQTT